jgi:serine/threonine-protein kinase PknK
MDCAPRDGLTAFQLQLANLVAEGLTNQAIAAQLTLTPEEVSHQVVALLRQLGMTRRVQIAVWAIQQRLSPPP